MKKFLLPFLLCCCCTFAAATAPIAGFRAPAVPLVTLDPFVQVWLRADAATDAVPSFWNSSARGMLGQLRIDGGKSGVYRFLGTHAGNEAPSLVQKSVTVFPTRTVFEFETPNSADFGLTLTFLSTSFATDIDAMARPVAYISVDFVARDGAEHSVQVYLDATGEHCVDNMDEPVRWNAFTKGDAVGVRMGTVAQNVLGRAGDKMGINWGYALLAGAAATQKQRRTVAVSVGAADSLRTSFRESGALPPMAVGPRPVSNGTVTMAVVEDLPAGASGSALFIFGYDDVLSVDFFGEKQAGLWTRKWASIEELIASCTGDYDDALTRSVSHDKELLDAMSAAGGDEYATICALAYRQTLAALKPTWSEKRGEPQLFLKEISTNGDMQTMDVIFPASPMLLHLNPKLLEMLLLPVLRYANNETSIRFTDPYSPHQLGVYPIANAKPKDQERMPMENTGNMFLMLLAIVQQNGGDTSFFFPRYWPLLQSWADFLQTTLPFPDNQLCTDDFEGAIANNTNLAAKGIVALAAFGKLCEVVTPSANCGRYRLAAEAFARTWTEHATAAEPSPHTLIAFNVHNTWSVKYNLVWQKLLKLGDSPFASLDTLLKQEIAFYKTKEEAFGFPLDLRFAWQKLDWMSWAALFEDDIESFQRIFHFIYTFAHKTPTRCSLSDLFWVLGGAAAMGPSNFVARPVVGAIFARALLLKE